jgi:hypothetical protein
LINVTQIVMCFGGKIVIASEANILYIYAIFYIIPSHIALFLKSKSLST